MSQVTSKDDTLESERSSIELTFTIPRVFKDGHQGRPAVAQPGDALSTESV